MCDSEKIMYFKLILPWGKQYKYNVHHSEPEEMQTLGYIQK